MSKSKKSKAKKGAVPPTKPVVDGVDPETCEHIDDNADGVCDLCGIEVEAVEDEPEQELDTKDKDESKKAEEKPKVEPKRSKDPRLTTKETPPVIPPSKPATTTVFRVRAGKFIDHRDGRTYKKGEPITVSPDEFDQLKNFIE